MTKRQHFRLSPPCRRRVFVRWLTSFTFSITNPEGKTTGLEAIMGTPARVASVNFTLKPSRVESRRAT